MHSQRVIVGSACFALELSGIIGVAFGCLIELPGCLGLEEASAVDTTRSGKAEE